MSARKTLGAALEYQAHGWSIVPARIGAKHALVSWKRWQQERPSREQLAAWWQRWPKANVALVTGAVSGVVVLDVDPRHGGTESLHELERRGDVPWLAVVETPSRGQHVYLAHPGEHIGNSAGRLGPGLDIRGDGGIALLPPSRRDEGAYRWAIGDPCTVPPMPAWFAECLAQQQTASQRRENGSRSEFRGVPGQHDAARLAGLLRFLERAPEGQRNSCLFWCAARIGEAIQAGAPQSWARVLADAAEQRGLSQREIRATLQSGIGEDLL